MITNLFCNQWCEYHFTSAENVYKIPNKVLHAIGLTETGKTIPKKGIIAWPWSININGKGYLFPSKQKAIFAAKFLKNSGFNNFDVGCMQVNLMHHEDAFQTLEDAFDPKKNVMYAASFLSSLFNQHGKWDKAIGHYHNAKPIFYIPYQKKVLGFLNKLTKTPTLSYVPHPSDLPMIEVMMDERFKDAEAIFSTSLKFEKSTPSKKIKPFGLFTPSRPIISKNNPFEKLNGLHKNDTFSNSTPHHKKQSNFSHLNSMTVNHFVYSPSQNNYKQIGENQRAVPILKK